MLKMIFGLFAAVISLIFLLVGAIALVGNYTRSKRCSARTTGTVTAIHTGGEGNRPVAYTPEFRFTANGHSYTIKPSFSSSRNLYRVGQTVTIRFDPADPGSAYVAADSKTSAQGGVMCVCISLVLAFAAALLFV